jgi:hypothetical protein
VIALAQGRPAVLGGQGTGAESAVLSAPDEAEDLPLIDVRRDAPNR